MKFRVESSNKVRVWQARGGSDLKSILVKWSEQENVRFTWKSNDKYRLDYDVFISGTFENAVEVLLSRGLKSSPDYKIETDPYGLSIRPSP